MADFHFVDAAIGGHATQIVAAKPVPQVFVSLCDASGAKGKDMHWVPELERSCPHEESNCRWCHYPMLRKVYWPVQQSPFYYTEHIMSLPKLDRFPETLPLAGWQHHVLEIPPSGFDLVKKLHRGSVFAVCRGKGKAGKKVVFRIFDNEVAGLMPAFDVVPFLLKAWGYSRATERR